MENQFWMCLFCRETDKNDINHSSETKVFLSYVDNIVRTVRGDKNELLDAVNNLHPNLQYLLETTDNKNSLPFLDMSISVKPECTIFCAWYQKQSDIGTIPNYRSCANLPHKKSIIQEIRQRLFRGTSKREAFHEALTKMKKFWNVMSILGIG